jgi:hypothetical protein
MPKKQKGKKPAVEEVEEIDESYHSEDDSGSDNAASEDNNDMRVVDRGNIGNYESDSQEDENAGYGNESDQSSQKNFSKELKR